MILVVGGTGRLGRLVVGQLAARHTVRVLARHAMASAHLLPATVELVDGDIRDPATVIAAAQGASCIVIASHGVESREPKGLRTVDELGSRAVAAAARQAGCAVVLVSIVGAASDAALPLARSKWGAENVIRESGARYTIVRASAFAQTWAMILTQSAGRSGRPAIIGSGAALHRFVDVRDVAAVVARAATDESLRGRMLEVRGPAELSISHLAAMVQQANSWSGPPRHVPLPLARMVALCLSPFRADLARMASIAISMNHPEPVDARGGDVPSWLVARAISSETIGGGSAVLPSHARTAAPTHRSADRRA